MVKTENCLYIYTWYVRIPYIHSALFVRDAIFPQCALVHVASHSYSRDKTRKTEWLNSQGNQRNRDLKNGEEKGGTISRR